MRRLLVIAIALVAVFQTGHSQGGFDDLENGGGLQLDGIAGRFNLDRVRACLGSDDDFLVSLIGCFLTKFDDLIGGIADADVLQAQDTYSGRKLQGYHHADEVLRQKVAIPRALENFQKTHKEFVDNMSVLGHVAKQKHKDQAMVKQLEGLNLKTELRKYITDLAKNLIPAKAKLTVLIQQAFRETARRAKDAGISPTIDEETIEFLCNFVPELCPLIRIGVCLDNQDEEAFEDGLEWLYCVYECVDLPDLSMCMVDLFNSTTPCSNINWLADVIIRGFVEFVQLGECAFKIVSPETEPIVLTEGQPGTEVEFITYMPPGAMCFGPNMLENPVSTVIDIVALLFGFDSTCDVQIQVSTNMYLYEVLPYINLDLLGIVIQVGRPKCATDPLSAINQVAVGFDEHSDTDASGVIRVTKDNWNSTFRIPITAVVDHKLDGDIDLNFTLKYVVEGTTHWTHKIPMTAKDSDPQVVSVCSAVNDPHITTFDGHYYNNLHHGWYQMYKHAILPYEVQAVFQACDANTQESCTCAVAVRSGDDVFMVDRCRRTPASCSGANCHPHRALLYTNGDLTPNTRIIHRQGGLEYDVILPHGTVVTISASRDLLNVWIKPSTFDKDSTMGLCGTFNENSADDLTLRNGSVFTGPGSNPQGQPREFNLDWRVPEGERIFAGAPRAVTEFLPESFCRCTHVIFEGVTCECDGGHQVETCDMNLAGELLEETLSPLIRHSLRRDNGSLATKGSSMDLGEVDIDESYEPPELIWRPGYITAGEALAFCNDLLDNNVYGNEIIRQCRSFLGPDTFNLARQACVEDLQITNNTLWKFSALEAAKKACMYKFTHTLDAVEASIFDRFTNSTCVNDCNMNGECIMGVCRCNSGYQGADCFVLAGEDISVATDRSALCDTRTEDCNFATVYGQNFPDDGSLRCTVRQATAGSGGISVTGRDAETVEVTYYSSNQVACHLPASGSYTVDLTRNGLSLLNSQNFYFITYDSVCYQCDAQTNICDTHNDGTYCLISGGCYANDQRKPSDSCHVCNVSQSTTDWTEHPEQRCEDIRVQAEEDNQAWQRDRQIRIGVACGLSGLVVIIVVIIYVVHRKREARREKKKATMETNNPSGSATEKGNDVYEETNINANNAGPSYDNAAINIDDEGGEYANVSVSNHDNRKSSEYTDLRVEALMSAAEKSSTGGTPSVQRQRNASTSSTPRSSRVNRERTGSTSSIRSIGIGGGGPARYSQYSSSVGEREVNPGVLGGVLTPRSAGGQPEEEPIQLVARF